jgi:error-prone DNA polymerase
MAALINQIPYAELNAKSNYSFLEGASHPEEMIERAHALGYQGIALTDVNGVYGAPRAHATAQKLGIHLIIGAEIEIEKDFKLILLSKNRTGYGNLCELLTLIHMDKPLELSNPLFDELVALCPYSKQIETHFNSLKDRFNNNLYLLAQFFFDGNEKLESLKHFSDRTQIPVIASNSPLFHIPQSKPLQDVLNCIKHTLSLKKAGFKILPNLERHLKSPTEIQKLFPVYPDWIKNTILVAKSCQFSLDEIKYRYPTEWLPPGETGDSYLEKLSFEGAALRYPKGIPEQVTHQIKTELALIKELSYSDYFLTIWDIVQFAQKERILYQGRGSAANSIVCYVLQITAIDPVRMSLLFERFISRERKEPPDIDIDFEHERREEVIQYIYKRYGRERSAITAVNICFRRCSAIREVAKAFDFPLEITARLLTHSHKRNFSEIEFNEWETLVPEIPKRQLKQFLTLVAQILSFPRHLGTHVGGFVLCQEKLSRNVPIENAAMQDRSIVQWDKNDLDALGFTRVDILGLGILTCIRKSFELLKRVYGIELTLATIPPEDPKVYEAIGRGDTIGVFQIESRAQMNMLPRLKPKTFFDLVIEISIVRPGPIQGKMVHPYLRRRNGEEKVEYVHPKLEAILGKTLGVPLFQEQVMKMAMEVAGFTGGEADELRRAMGTWRRDKNKLATIGRRFHAGLIKNNIPSQFADSVFQQIEGFAEYGFPESHAASFALLAYATAYLKHYYPDVYLTALLNSQPMGFYQSHTLIHDAIRHGVTVLPLDIQKSDWDNKLEEKNRVRLGYREIKGLSKHTGLAIHSLSKPFSSFQDFVTRLRDTLHPKVLTRRDLFHLAGADAFTNLGLSRRQALWEIQALHLSDSHLLWSDEEKTILTEEADWERISLDFDSAGVSLFSHPMKLLRSELKLKGLISASDISKVPPNRRVTVSGIVVSRQMPPTANGVLFITLEDEFGFINLVIWNEVFQKFRNTLLQNSFLMCEGKIQRAKGASVIHIIVEAAYPLFVSSNAALTTKSHDFC